MISERRAYSLDRAPQQVHQPGLIVVKHQTVQGMNDDWSARELRSKPSKHARLRRMSVDYVVTPRPNQAIELPKSFHIRQRTYAAAQFRHDDEPRSSPRAFEEVTLRSVINAGYERYFVIGKLVQALD